MAYNPQNPNGSATSANSTPVVIASDQAAVAISGTVTANAGTGTQNVSVQNASLAVTGSFYQATQPVSIAASVAVTGPLTDTQIRATALPVSIATLPALATGSNAIGSITNTSFASTQSGTWNITNISGTVSLPTGAATSAKQPALGTAGTASADVISVQGIANATAIAVKATSKFSIGSSTAMTVTSLQSLANSATVGWQSDRVSNLSTLARDYEIFVKLTTANTAAANDKAMYVYICPWYTTDGGSSWLAASQGTTILPTGSQSASTIATPNNLRLLGVLNYNTATMPVQDVFLLSNCFGDRLPDGFSIIIINFSGAALSTGCVVNYTPINDTLV